MKHILILGAGKSTYELVKYLAAMAGEKKWEILLADMQADIAEAQAKPFSQVNHKVVDISIEAEREKLIKQADLVISFLPPRFHPLIAESCLKAGKNLVTPSYLSAEMEKLDIPFKEKGLICINEAGLDPGIDHASARELIDRLKKKGAEINSFESSTGGLISPGDDNNPWKYKFTWNPGGIVNAGKQVNRYLLNGQEKVIPYHNLFKRTKPVSIFNTDDYEIYPNRDALPYRKIYDLENVKTFFRGTIRPVGFCKSWSLLVEAGLTMDGPVLQYSNDMTWNDLLETLLPEGDNSPLEKMKEFFKISDEQVLERLKWLGIFDHTPLEADHAAPIQHLKKLLEKKWQLQPDDKDMIIMLHKIKYRLKGQEKVLTSRMICYGNGKYETAMAKTVGLPAGICAKLLLEGKVSTPGMLRPVIPEIYHPVLEELRESGIVFEEHEKKY